MAEETEPTVFPGQNIEPALVAPLGGIPSFDEIQQEEQADKAEATAAQPQADDPEQVVENAKKYVNPNARVRIVEREKRELAMRLHDLEVKLDRALKAQEAEAAADVAPQEDEIDIEKDPAKALYKKMEKVEKELAESKKHQKMSVEQMEREAALAAVNSRMIEYKDDPILNGALEHIGAIMKRNIERQHPDKTHGERIEIGKKAAQDLYVSWIKNGKDPVEETVSLAVDYGYTAKNVSQAGKKAPKADAKEEIQADKERAAGTASLGAAPGKSPGKANLGRLIDGDENDFAFKVRSMQKEGLMKKGRLGVPSFGDLARMSSGK